MASELAKYGLQLPAFSKIGGLLASELSVDEAAGGSAPCAGVGSVQAGLQATAPRWALHTPHPQAGPPGRMGG